MHCRDILCCILGLSSTDALIFEAVKKPMTVSDLMSLTGKSQPRVQVSLSKLSLLGLLEKEQVSSGHGIKYVYKPVERVVVRRKLLSELKSSYSRIKKEIEEF